MCAAKSASVFMASCEDAEWYLEGSGVPVGWNERAVGFKVVPLPFAVSF